MIIVIINVFNFGLVVGNRSWFAAHQRDRLFHHDSRKRAPVQRKPSLLDLVVGRARHKEARSFEDASKIAEGERHHEGNTRRGHDGG